MIEAAMYVALGFCTAGLIGLAILPAFYRRAARLTEEALRAVNPASYAEVRAAQDQERARYAVELRRVETRLDSEREKAARFHLEASRLRTEIEQQAKTSREELAALQEQLAAQSSDQHAVDMLSAEIKTLKTRLSESEKALAESWAESPEDAPADAASPETGEDDDRDWLPATDTMALATITGLEAEVATLKTRLARYEPTVASEVEATLKDASKSRLAELEAQLVDTESKYVSAQAEVTRLSLMLEAASAPGAEPDKQLQAQLRKLTGEVTGYQSELQDKDRALQRMTGQMRKLRSDLAAVPELTKLRADFRALAQRLSETDTISVKPEPAPAPAQTPDEAPGKKAPPAAPETPQASGPAVNGTKTTPRETRPVNGAISGPVSGDLSPKITAPVPEPAPAQARSADIASAAEALVSRIVASSRNKKKSEDGGQATEARAPEAAPEQDSGKPRKSRSAKQKKKDVA